jgi:hypothetical protein
MPVPPGPEDYTLAGPKSMCSEAAGMSSFGYKQTIQPPEIDFRF